MAPGNGANIVHLTGQSIRAIALGVVVTELAQASLGAAGLWVAVIPFAGVLSALMLIMCLPQEAISVSDASNIASRARE
ncbi:hypothetical protein [Paraburkholderia panacisoli]|uniref:hypothetical protein n=1 Tax=Paraburkholderia panacisoli TaxID=2603818 RepID=UPI001FECFC25|nr:hypothetical protein [Paraburkholderia panacisoli]